MFRAGKRALQGAVSIGANLVLVAGALACAGCGAGEDWPPAPRNEKERLMVASAMRAVGQHDGWSEVACVVKRSGPSWRVEAWKVVHPAARGRKKCVPWSVRFITLDDDGAVKEYRNAR